MGAVVGMVLSEEVGGPFDLVNGLPVHPLVIHAAVVLVPLTALGLIAMALWPRFSRTHGWLVVASGLVATASCFVAKQSGEALEERVGEPGFDHGELGELMPILAAVLLIAVLLLWLVDRSAPTAGPPPRRALRVVVAVIGVLVAVGNLVWVVRVGDSGAKSVWTGKVASSTPDPGSDDDD